MMTRAVSRKTVNRYLAPKLACCCSISSVISKIETRPRNPRDLGDSFLLPEEKSDSKWWIQCTHERGLTREEVNMFDTRSCLRFVENRDGGGSDSFSSWQMAGMDGLDSFVSNQSRVLIEDCGYDRGVDTGLEQRVMECGGKGILQGRLPRDTSKSKILEALCHAQTRAREAEIAAKKAYAEKEHAIKILFGQASQLLAYRRLIHLLQVENLCYQIENTKIDQFSSVVRVSGSENGDSSTKMVISTKGKRIGTKYEPKRYKHDLGKYVIFLVVGLGIVGGGVLFGWTLGWMLI